jgi:hypothetical protein
METTVLKTRKEYADRRRHSMYGSTLRVVWKTKSNHVA